MLGVERNHESRMRCPLIPRRRLSSRNIDHREPKPERSAISARSASDPSIKRSAALIRFSRTYAAGRRRAARKKPRQVVFGQVCSRCNVVQRHRAHVVRVHVVGRGHHTPQKFGSRRQTGGAKTTALRCSSSSASTRLAYNRRTRCAYSSVIDDPAPDGVEQITQIRCRDIVVRPQVLGKKIAFGYPCFAFAPRFIRKENCQ